MAHIIIDKPEHIRLVLAGVLSRGIHRGGLAGVASQFQDGHPDVPGHQRGLRCARRHDGWLLRLAIDGNDLDRLIRSLWTNGARMMVKGSGPQTGQGTNPVMPGYPCIISPELYTDLSNVSGFRSVETYKASGTMFEGEMGRYKNLVFFIAPDADNLGAGARIFTGAGAPSSVVTNTGGVADVHTILAFGEEYLTHVPLTGESVGMIFHKVGSAGTADPLNQVGTAGWKETSTRLRTNESWGGRVETGVSL